MSVSPVQKRRFLCVLETFRGSIFEKQRIEKAIPKEAAVQPVEPRKLLVFWKCESYFHTSIPVGNKALELMGKKTGAYDTIITDDYSIFTTENLKQFDVVCFNNSTHLEFDPKKTPDRCKALMDFIKGGKGIVGPTSTSYFL